MIYPGTGRRINTTERRVNGTGQLTDGIDHRLSKTERRQHYGHEYHAEAHLLSGQLDRPIVQTIPHQARVSLRDWSGGHIYERLQGYDLEGLVSFKSGYTRVSGYRSGEREHAFVTLATSVIEGLNIFDVLTADRVVAQVSTSHPEPKYGETKKDDDLGHVPEVTFLGSQFTNLKIGGYKVKPILNPEICGARPKGDVSYLFDGGFLGRAREQATAIAKFNDEPNALKEQAEAFRLDYSKEVEDIDKLSSLERRDDRHDHKLNCSLVQDIHFPKDIPGVKHINNVLYIRDFGIVTLGSVTVGRRNEPEEGDTEAHMSNYFEIKMFEMRLGCVGEGTLTAASGSGNGRGKP